MTSAASPEELSTFVAAAGGGNASLLSEIARLRASYDTFQASGSTFAPVSNSTLMDSELGLHMANRAEVAVFAEVVRLAVTGADVYPENGVVTLTDAQMTAAFNAAARAQGYDPASLGPGPDRSWIDNPLYLLPWFSSPEAAWAQFTGRREAVQLADASAAEQLAWWRVLTPQQQAALLEGYPSLLLAMDGLPADVYDRAHAAAVDDLGETVAVVSHDAQLRGEIEIAGLHAAADVGYETVVHPDGTTEVRVYLAGELGAAVGGGDSGGSVSLRGEAARRYEFADEEAAEEFIDDLIGAAEPERGLDMFRALSPGTYVIEEYREVFDRYDDNYQEATVAGELNADIDLRASGAGEIELNGGVGVEYNLTTEETTGYVSIGGEAELHLGAQRYALTGDVEARLTWDEDENLQRLVVSGSIGGEGLVGADISSGGNGPTLDSALRAGRGAAFQAELDLTDPAAREAALDLVGGTASGQPVAAGDALSRVIDASDVVVQTTATETAGLEVGGSAGGFGAQIEIDTSNTEAQATYIKPAYGEMTEFDHDTGSD
jgi:hypothetical protein